MIDCDSVRKLLGRWYDGEVDRATSGEIGDHVDRCPGCAAEIEALRRLDAALTAEVDPGDLGEHVLAAIRGETAHGVAWWLRLVAATAAAVVLGLAAGRQFDGHHPQPTPRTQAAVFASLDQSFGPEADAGLNDLARELGGGR